MLKKLKITAMTIMGLFVVLLVAGAAFGPSTSFAAPGSVAKAEPKKFNTLEEVADFTQDFSVEEGTLKIVARKPLHIELTVSEQGDQRQAANAMFRAFLWGVFRTFLHTDADSVKVTVVSPVAVEGNKSFTASASRARALKVVQQLLGVADFNGLITERQSWSDDMKRCYYSDFGRPGLRECALAVAGLNPAK